MPVAVLMMGMLWQVTTAPDSLPVQVAGAPHGNPAELVVKNPVPGLVGRLFQIAFNLPTWLQWGGIVVGVMVGLVLLGWLYTRRAQLGAFLSKQSSGYKTGLASLAAVMILGAGGVGYAGNHYMQHNNDFCVGCHVMGDAWGAFQRSEHRKLECHSCHRQSIFASARQLYFWVAERPEDIPKHAKVPTAVCSECHVQSRADSGWKRISATAGHRLHLNSDSSALKNIACVTCHGQEVHRFKSVDKTCGQTGCHQSKDTKIVLGAMAGQTSQHCTGCHTFTRVIPENISMDSTRKYLVANGSAQSCFGCHQMKDKLHGFDIAKDRGHKGVCGACHNPHKQTAPKQAYESCATNGCHGDLAAKSKFHAGLKGHKTVGCGPCHQAHEWKPIGRECIDCHKGIFDGKSAATRANQKPKVKNSSSSDEAVPSSLQRPIGNRVSLRAVRVGRGVHHGIPVRIRDGGAFSAIRVRAVVRHQSASTPQPPVKPQPAAAATVAPKDSPAFSHKIHKVLACAGCHDQKNSHGALNVRNKAECASCHHAADRSVSCEGCHDARTKLTKVLSRAVTMKTSAASAPRQRALPFAHRSHRDLECKSCHTNGILLGVTRDCQSCHADHHNAERSCTSCHSAPPKTAHTRAAHDGCAGSTCHTNSAVLSLPPSRATCVSCHQDQANHKPKRECAECHVVTWNPATATPR